MSKSDAQARSHAVPRACVTARRPVRRSLSARRRPRGRARSAGCERSARAASAHWAAAPEAPGPARRLCGCQPVAMYASIPSPRASAESLPRSTPHPPTPAAAAAGRAAHCGDHGPYWPTSAAIGVTSLGHDPLRRRIHGESSYGLPRDAISALRSALPLGVSGNFSNRSNWRGTM